MKKGIDRILEIIVETAKFTGSYYDLTKFATGEIQSGKPKSEIVRELQANILNSSPVVVVGRAGCSSCDIIKENLKTGQLYIESEIVVEYLSEIVEKEKALPLVFLKGELVADGQDVEKINAILTAGSIKDKILRR